jgi:hypothetical protein
MISPSCAGKAVPLSDDEHPVRRRRQRIHDECTGHFAKRAALLLSLVSARGPAAPHDASFTGGHDRGAHAEPSRAQTADKQGSIKIVAD